MSPYVVSAKGPPNEVGQKQLSWLTPGQYHARFGAHRGGLKESRELELSSNVRWCMEKVKTSYSTTPIYGQKEGVTTRQVSNLTSHRTSDLFSVRIDELVKMLSRNARHSSRRLLEGWFGERGGEGSKRSRAKWRGGEKRSVSDGSTIYYSVQSTAPFLFRDGQAGQDEAASLLTLPK
jgi:hypothetical protein